MNPQELSTQAAALGYDFSKTPIVEFTAVRMGWHQDFTRDPAVLGRVERRLQNMMEEAGTLPVEGKCWRTIDAFVQSQKPDYEGPINRTKAFEWGLYNTYVQSQEPDSEGPISRTIAFESGLYGPRASPIRVYADGTFFPQQRNRSYPIL